MADIVNEVIENWETSRQARAGIKSVVLDERSFVYRMNHYRDESEAERNQHRVRPRGRQLASKLRHKISRIAASPIDIDLRAESQDTTPEQDEIATAVVESIIHDPKNHYRRLRRRMVSLACSARAGALTWIVCYDRAGRPRVTPRFTDPLNWHWAAGFVDPDDPECPWVLEERVMLLDGIKEMRNFGWTIPRDLRPDGSTTDQAEGDGLTTRNDVLTGTRDGSAGGLMTDYRMKNAARVLLCWYRKDYTLKPADSGERLKLEPGEQYLACPTCGRRMKANGEQPPATGPCPDCGDEMGRVEEEAVLDEVRAYPEGRLVVVLAEQKKKLYDDKWPWAMRDVPLMWYPCYEDPLAQWGISDTTLDRDLQCVMNALDRRAYEAAMRSPSVIISTDDLTMPNSREPFEFTDDPVALAVWRGQGAPQVEFFKPEPVQQGLIGLRNMLANDLRADMGTSDLGVRGEQLKGVTATTAQVAYQTGEIPVDDHIAQLQEREGPFFGIGFDIWRDVNQARSRIPVPVDSGRTEWVEVRGSDLPSYNFTVTSGPDFASLDIKRAEAVRTLLATPPEEREWVAQAMGFPTSLLRKIQRAQARMMATQPQPGGEIQPPINNGPPMNGLPGGMPSGMRLGLGSVAG